MDRAIISLPLVLLPLFTVSLCTLPGVWASNSTPRGCSSVVDPLFYNMCDLDAVWGVVVEAFAAAGAVLAFVLLVALVASMPFVRAEARRSVMGLQLGLLVCTKGLFGLSFAFIARRNFSVCVVRRFLFGVLFAGCFACLLMHGVTLNALARDGRGYRGWKLCLGAAGLWLAEVIINALWLVITILVTPPETSDSAGPCAISNKDFVLVLIYVLLLLMAVFVAAVASVGRTFKDWQRSSAFILVSGVLSLSIWVTWIFMYVFGNEALGKPNWDDPTLAITLIANGWVFLAFYIIPEVATLPDEGKDPQPQSVNMYRTEGASYNSILNERKDLSSQNVYVENKAFTPDEPSAADFASPPSQPSLPPASSRPVSPYSGYNGQIRSCVYQPTELALITKGFNSRMEISQDSGSPWITSPSLPQSSRNSTAQPDDRIPDPGQSRGDSGNSLQVRPLW
ncbi:hypothetical protein GJAV_G00221360 [Gymnothorax javanicus]|nr:hypothetical protein GJAV_G00221360 [Gymnothorax javanicus]